MKITKATKQSSDGRANLPGYELVQLEFSDGTKFAIQSEELGFPRIYAHDLLDEYLKAGGKIA
jgi:hypothetical protein